MIIWGICDVLCLIGVALGKREPMEIKANIGQYNVDLLGRIETSYQKFSVAMEVSKDLEINLELSYELF